MNRKDLEDIQYAKLVLRYQEWAPISEVERALEVMTHYYDHQNEKTPLEFFRKTKLDGDFVLRII